MLQTQQLSSTQLNSTQLNSAQLSSAVTMKCHRQHVTLSDDVTCAEAWRPSPATRPVAPAASSSPVHPVTLACASTCVSRSRWAASARADQAAGNPFNTSTNPLDTKLQEILSTPVQTHSAPSCRKSFQHQYKPTRHQAAGNPFNTSTNPLDTNYDNFIIQYSPLLSSTDVYKARLRLVFRSRCLGFLVFILMTVVGFVLSVSQPSDWLTRPLQQQGL